MIQGLDWKAHHRIYEYLAQQAEMAWREGRQEEAGALYRLAARSEEEALWLVQDKSSRTFFILAVSASVSWLKAGDSERASQVASNVLKRGEVSGWARNELASLMIDGAEAGR